MSGLTPPAALACVVLASAALAAPSAVAADAGAGARTASVDVVEKEMHIAVSPATIPAGKITLHVRNAGTVEHELVLLRGSTLPGRKHYKADESRRITELEELPPGGKGTLTVTLPPGGYLLICNLAGHYQLGMHAQLRVGP